MRDLRGSFGRLVFLGAFALSAAAVPAAATNEGALASVRAQLTATRATLIAGIEHAKAHSDDPYGMITRLDDALAALDAGRATTDSAYVTDAGLEASLERSLVDQILGGACADPRSVKGTGEVCVRSSRDGTLQPLAITMPSTYHAQPATPLIVFLHGRGETEASLVSLHEVRDLAEASGAIVAAPYARGRAAYDGVATQDVVDATDAVTHALGIDPQRVYIAGFSMGGMAAFHVVGAAPGRYRSLLSIAGALEAPDRDAASAALRDHRAYLVSGAKDDIVPAANSRDAARFLHSRGVDVSYYEQPNANHSLRSLAPALGIAWRDMLAGASHGFNEAPEAGSAGIDLPAPPAPAGTMRPP